MNAWRTWWRYGTQRWTFRDYVRHFAYVAAGVFVATMHYIVIMNGGAP